MCFLPCILTVLLDLRTFADMLKELDLDEFCTEFPVASIKETLLDQAKRYNPDGWFICVCEMLDSSKLGRRWVLPYGPSNTYTDVPTNPFSIDGTASGTVCARFFMSKDKLKSDVQLYGKQDK